jgi:protein-tyrosine phosphatase
MRVLMVCLGNICRSPMAEGVLRHLAKNRGVDLEIDSCGTAGYHIGSPPDRRAVYTMSVHGIDISELRARQFKKADFSNFDYIVTMDVNNFDDIMTLANSDTEAGKVRLMLNYSSPHENQPVPDPYYGGDEGFENVYHLLSESCNAFLDQLETAS